MESRHCRSSPVEAEILELCVPDFFASVPYTLVIENKEIQ